MPLAGLTAFGFKGALKEGLQGEIYDLKQTPDHQPTDIVHNPPPPLSGHIWNPSIEGQIKVFEQLFMSTSSTDPDQGWDDSLLKRYYKSTKTVTAFQVLVPFMFSTAGPAAFGVEKEIPQASHWLVLYKGKVVAPKDGTFRFLGRADDQIAVRFNGRNVFLHTLEKLDKPVMESFNGISPKTPEDIGINYGKWFSVERGKTYPIEILIAEMPGGWFTAQLYIEDKNPEKPYPHRTLPGAEKYLAYPVFQLKKGVPLPERKTQINEHMSENYPEVAPDPVIFQGR